MKHLLAGLALFLAAPAVAVAQPNLSNLPANSVVGRLGLGTGPGQAIPFAVIVSKILAGSPTITGGLTINPVTGINPGLTINQVLTGAAGATNWNSITIASDNVAGSFLADMNVTHSFGGAAATGARVGQFNWLIQTAATSASNTSRNYLASECLSQTNTGDGGTGTAEGTAKGAYFGCNSLVRNAGTNVYNMFSHELDLQSTSTSSARYSAAGAFVNFEAVQGTAVDAGALFYSGSSVAAAGGGGPYGPGIGFHNGILFAELASNGLVPIDSAGSVLSTYLSSLSNIPVTNGIDLRGFTVSGLAFASTGFKVDGTGATDINKNANPASAGTIGNSPLRLALLDTSSAPLLIDAFAGAPTYAGRRTGGTALSKVNVGAGDILSQFVGQGWTTGAAYGVQSGSVAITAAETFTASAQGTRIDFKTTPNTTIVPATAMTIQNSGGVSIGGAADPGTGKMAVGTAYLVSATQVVGARITGYAAMTGTPDKATAFATSTVTLAQLAGRVMQLQADLTTHGLIGP